MTIDPRWGFYIGLVLTILGVISNSETLMHTMFSPTVAGGLVAWSNFVLTIGTGVMTYIHAFSSQEAGPLVPKPKAP